MSVNKHTLWMHIGTPKTGTSAIQRFLHDNRDKLFELGWIYPRLKCDEEDNICNSYSVCRIYERIIRNDKNAESEWDQVLSPLVSELEQHNVILSTEDFWVVDNSLRDLFIRMRKLFSRIKVVVYLRRQDLYLESGWNQMIKIYEYAETLTLSEFYTKTDYWNKFNYLKTLQEIADVIGVDNLIVRSYEKDQFVGATKDVVSDFLTMLNIPIEKINKYEKPDVNPSFNWQLAEIKRIWNSIYDKNTYRYWMRLFDKYSILHPINRANGRAFTPEQRKKFMENFNEENAEVARRFQHKADGVLFQDMNMDIPVSYEEATPLMRETISFFLTILNKQNLVNDMRNRVLVETQISHKKKLAYFGAGNVGQRCLSKYSYNVAEFIDNSPKVDNIEGVPIVLASDIDRWDNTLVIVTCDNYATEIETQLRGLGLRKNIDFMHYIEFFYDELT